jgi:hypothetical protein
MPVLNPDHLLDQADRLLAAPSGGAPRQADLRRAISSAYYAVFHALLTEAADDLIGRRQRDAPRYALVYRSIDHRRLKSLCEDIQKPALPDKYSNYLPAGGFSSDLRKLAFAIVDLQEKRHLADYDPRFRVRASDAELAIAAARDALALFRSAPRTQRQALLSLLVFSPR